MNLSPRPPIEFNPSNMIRGIKLLKHPTLNRRLSPVTSKVASHENLPKLEITKSRSASTLKYRNIRKSAYRTSLKAKIFEYFEA